MIPRQTLLDSQFEDLHQDIAPDLSIMDLSTEQVFDLWEKAQRILLAVQDMPAGQAIFLHGEQLILVELMRRALDGDTLASRNIVCDKYAPNAGAMEDPSLVDVLDAEAADEEPM